jgi:hypothetical protein
MSAIAVGKYFKVPGFKIKAALENYVPSQNRSQYVAYKGGKIILDAYNANPSSMAVAIENFLQLDNANKIIILGDMFELGEESTSEHKAIVSLLLNENDISCFFIGEDFFENEINAVTDNPTIFPDEDHIVSGGNFHGQPLAITLDFLAIAMAEMGSISERRVYKLISGTRGLPPFLVAEPGLNSGFMIVQYTCASIVSQNKQYCTPASIDSIDSSNGQEDHVSMGANAATKFLKIIDNCFTIQGIEILTALQAIEFRRPLKSSSKNEELITEFRKEISFTEKDEFMQPKIQKAREFVLKLQE